MFCSGWIPVMFPRVPHLECHRFPCLLSNRCLFPPWQSDVPEGVIRVHAPLLSKVSMAIQLNSQTKVRDILAKFQCENRWVHVRISVRQMGLYLMSKSFIWKFDLFEKLEPVTLRTSPVNEDSTVEKEVYHRLINNKSFFFFTKELLQLRFLNR